MHYVKGLLGKSNAQMTGRVPSRREVVGECAVSEEGNSESGSLKALSRGFLYNSKKD